jgi:hypothetical protein
MNNWGERLVEDFRKNAHNRVRVLFFLFIGAFAILMLRVGYMNYIYQNNIVTFAQIDQKAKQQNNLMIEEVKNSFGVQLEQFREVNTEELILSGKTDAETLSLIDTVTTACEQGCIGQPVIYLHDSHGYIFLKNGSEQNVLVELKKQKDHWAQISKQKVD